MNSYNNDEEYQNLFLKFFNLVEYDDEKIMSKIEKLYLQIKDIPVFQEQMRKGASGIMSDDLEMGLVVLFSYDHFANFYQLLENHQIKLSD